MYCHCDQCAAISGAGCSASSHASPLSHTLSVCMPLVVISHSSRSTHSALTELTELMGVSTGVAGVLDAADLHLGAGLVAGFATIGSAPLVTGRMASTRNAGQGAHTALAAQRMGSPQTPIDSFINRCCDGDLDEIRYLLTEDSQLVHEKDHYGLTGVACYPAHHCAILITTV